MSIKKQFLKTKPTAKVTFSLPKEAVNGGKEVVLLGEFNNWDVEAGIPMKASKGEFKAVVELTTGRDYEFRYLIDKQVWENDWAADDYIPNPFGFDNSVVALPGTPETLDVVKKAPKKSTKKVSAKKTVAPKKAVAKKAVKDDLKKIEGIGPKIASLLNAAGIVTFADLSKATQKTLKAVLTEAGNRFKMHDPTTWPKQAKLAAQGKWDELKKLQDELNGGRA
ncbi:MAG: DUF4332 domain-containing protein [Bacteroidota bacterium]